MTIQLCPIDSKHELSGANTRARFFFRSKITCQDCTNNQKCTCDALPCTPMTFETTTSTVVTIRTPLPRTATTQEPTSNASEQQSKITSTTVDSDTIATIIDEPAEPETIDNESGALDQPTLIAIIVGSILGCLLLIASIAVVILALKRRQRRRRPVEPRATAPNQRTGEYASSSILGTVYDKAAVSDLHHYDHAGSTLRF